MNQQTQALEHASVRQFCKAVKVPVVGANFEQLAADLVVRLVERYLAEYREVLQASPECRQVLVELLDTFIRAGWSSARQLTYRLEDIFR